MNKNKSIILFHQKNIRRHWDADKELWYFSVVDVVEALTDSTTPRRYWSDLKIKLKQEGSEVYDKIVQLKMVASDGKKYLTDCFCTEDLLRTIQSIPSPKAEPFKVWLAQVGYERIEETEDPERSIDRAMKTYLQKGYSKEWINQRLKTIEVRKELTDEWKERGAEEGAGYAILTDEITRAWTGKSVKEYKKFKGLKNQNLRDNMTNLELILNMLAEATTTKLHKDRDSKDMGHLRKDAIDGGSVAGNARKEIEQKSGKNVLAKENYLALRKIKKLK